MKQKILLIENELEKIESQRYLNMNMTRKKRFRNQLDKLYKNKLKGAQIRSRAKWIDEGGKFIDFFKT